MIALHGWALAGAILGLILPVLIHLLTKPRGERRALPTFRFLQQSANFSVKRSKLRAWLILSTRALALLLLALGFARLIHGARAAGGGDGAAQKRKVIVLDCSMSMKAVVGQVAVFDRARQAAQQVLEEPDTRAADLILAAHKSQAIFGTTSSNLAALKDEAAKGRGLCEALDANGAIDLAARSFAGLDERELSACEVVIVSDWQRGNWAQANFSKLPKGIPVRMIQARGGEALGNVALVKAGVNGHAEAGAPLEVFADVANYGAAPVEAELELNFDGRTWSRRVSVPAGGTSRTALELADVAPGWRHGQFKLNVPAVVEDALSDDNRFPICVRVRDARRVALITQEKPRETGGPAYFLERGLSAAGDTTVQVTRFLPAQLEGEVDDALRHCDLLVLANVGTLSDGQTRTLARLLSSGTPVLYAAQTALDADNLKTLENALGAALRLPVQFAPYKGGAKSSALTSMMGGQGAERYDAGGGRFLVWVETQRRPFKIFGDSVVRFTQTMRLTGGLSSSARDDAVVDAPSILARYSDGSAALVLANVAAGRLAILNASVGGSEQHLARQPLFVPLIQELCQELLENPSDSGSDAIVCGSAVNIAFKRPAPKPSATGAAGTNTVTSTESGLRLLRADGSAVELSGADAPVFHADSTNGSLYWSRAADPGVYLIDDHGATLAGFAVVPPSGEESDLATLNEDVIRNRLMQNRTLTVVGVKDSGAGDEGLETYDAFFAGALLCLLLELGLLKAFKT